MADVPGFRTRPTIKPAGGAGAGRMTGWELRLCMWQVVTVVLIFCGSLCGSFLFGYYSGHTTGMDRAQSASLSEIPRFPIETEQNMQGLAPEDVSKVYARLENSGESFQGTGKAEGKSEVVDSLAMAMIEEETGDASARAALDIEEYDILDGTRIGGADVAKKDARTLGSMVEEEIIPDLRSEEDQKIAKEVIAAKKEVEIKAENPVQHAALVKMKSESEKKIEKTPVKEIAGVQEKKIEPVVVPAKKVVAPKKKEVEIKKEYRSRFLRESISSGWYAQVAAPVSLQDADGLSSKLVNSGFRVSIERAVVKGANYYRVLVGPEENRRMAEMLKSQLGREGYLKTAPFIRKIR